MYEWLRLAWSQNPPPAETAYRQAGLVKTKGTIYLLPPPEPTLRDAFNAPPRPKSRMSSGANALCKHFERGGASSERGVAHPFWTLPVGSNDNKTRIAADILGRILDDAVWRNVMMLHPGVAVYEMRNERGYGMRWTLHLDPIHGAGMEDDALSEGRGEWSIRDVVFRGFVEPQPLGGMSVFAESG